MKRMYMYTYSMMIVDPFKRNSFQHEEYNADAL